MHLKACRRNRVVFFIVLSDSEKVRLLLNLPASPLRPGFDSDFVRPGEHFPGESGGVGKEPAAPAAFKDLSSFSIF
jgi:hypothetical protein